MKLKKKKDNMEKTTIVLKIVLEGESKYQLELVEKGITEDIRTFLKERDIVITEDISIRGKYYAQR